MKQILISIIVLVSIASALAITGTNDQNNINITRGQISIAPINTEISIFILRGASQLIASMGEDTDLKTRFGILIANAAPDAPLLIKPVNGSYINDTQVEFGWETTDENNDTLTNLLEVFNDTIFTQEYYRNDSIEPINFNVTSHNLTVLEDITLYWRVMANDSEFNSSFSENRTFTIDTTYPSSFNLTTPANNTQDTDTSPELTWEAATEANLENYTIEFCTNPGCANATIKGSTRETSFSNWTMDNNLDTAATYYWQVTAIDKANNQNTSQLFVYIVKASVTNTITTTTGGGGGEIAGSTGTQLFSLSIISPPDIILVKDSTITIPLTVRNPARLVTLRGIKLDIVSDTKDVIPKIEQTEIIQLSPRQEIVIPLTLTAVGQPGVYGMTITGTVSNPEFVDKVRILANLIEAGAAEKTKTSKQLDFAKDLIDGNPECLDLKEYIAQVEEEINNGNVDKAFSILEATIINCQKLISIEKSSLRETITGSAFEISYLLKENQPAVIITAESLAFLLVLLILVKILRKKKSTTSRS